MIGRPLVGRTAELSRLRGLLGLDAGTSERSLVLLGGIGAGKSALLSAFAEQARGAGLRVLIAAGRAEERTVPFAGLHHLLRPVLTDFLGVPGQAGEDLRGALSLLTPAARPDPSLASLVSLGSLASLASLVGSALLELFDSAALGRVLLLIDDAQWLDEPSLEALGFAARRLDGGPAALVIAARGAAAPAAFGRCAAELRLAPLSRSAASELLDGGARPPRGRLRAQILKQAAGNPLALVELASAADGPGGRCESDGPLPPTDRLRAAFAPEIDELASPVKRALLLLAAAGDADRDHIIPVFDPGVLAPAEDRGLITVDSRGVRFCHPAIPSVIYHGAAFARRAAAHRKIAEAMRDLDLADRQAWHLGAAALGPDERIAARLLSTARQAERRGGSLALARALERAAALSPDPASRASRAVAAAEALLSAGQAEWARDTAAAAADLTRNRRELWRAERVRGSALTWSGCYTAAADQLLSLAGRSAGHDPATAWEALALASTAAYQSGAPARLADMLHALPRAAGHEFQALRLWARAVAGHVPEALTDLAELGDGAPRYWAGAAAWRLDQSQLAIEILRAARSGLARAEPAERAACDGPLAALAWACFDTGRWDEALAESRGIVGTDIAPASATLVAAMIAAARGSGHEARAMTAAAIASCSEQSRAMTARAHHVLALTALADDDAATALTHLRQLFDSDGVPYHSHISYLAIGDLAAAATRAGCRSEGQDILKHVHRALDVAGNPPSPRLRQQLARAAAILADPATADAYPDGILNDTSGDQWPFERAQLQLDYGQWLRRRRRINAAKPILSSAHTAFQALGARPWQFLAGSELRACGVTVAGAAPPEDGLSRLTSQQRQIVRLAAAGLSNQSIAERLFLSPRTVASHLYRSFPKLGVADRHQLRDLLPLLAS